MDSQTLMLFGGIGAILVLASLIGLILKLLRKQAWLLGAQALLTLGMILASPWLPFAG